jgi:Fic family protein
MNYKMPILPLKIELETKRILKILASARSAIAELKGVAAIIPNQSILINTLSLQEAKDSSAIENIITTHDELYKSDIFARSFASPAAKEVYNYASALKYGYEKVKATGILTNNNILEIQATLEENSAGFRVLPGTALKNDKTGETVYMPPQEPLEIKAMMSNLEQFINIDEMSDLDPLIKMAIIHHQFESIHPFYDGNGRTGRIINILYLVKKEYLNSPILYLSRFINQHKADYYRLLQEVRDKGSWEEWILFILTGIEQTSKQTILLIQKMKDLMQSHKHKIRSELKKIYSQDLINTIFCHPYTKIEFVMRELNVSRITATRYLDKLVEIKLMNKAKIGRESYYINSELFNLLSNVHGK